MIEPIEFEVIGLPAPQGSKKHVGRGIMVESSKALKPWRDSVASAARDIAECDEVQAPLTGALILEVWFRFPMPKSRPKSHHRAGLMPKITAPDLDKLVRAVGDALKVGGLIQDDALFWEVRARKYEVTSWTGAVIRLDELR